MRTTSPPRCREKVKEMQDVFYAEAKKYDVLPARTTRRSRASSTPRPSATAGRTAFTYSGGLERRRRPRVAPDVMALNKSYTIDGARWRSPRGRRGRHDRDRGRTVRGLRPVPEQRHRRLLAGATSSSSTTCSTLSAPTWEGPELERGQARHPCSTFKSDWPRAWARAAPACCSWTARRWPRRRWNTLDPRRCSRKTRTFDVGPGHAAPGWRGDRVPLRLSVQVSRERSTG